MNNSSLSKFVEKAKQVHEGKYDYSLADYKSAKEYINIICKEHGIFQQSPSCHLSGRGCKLCGRKKLANFHLSNTEQFIEKAKQVHEDKYDYSLVNYVNCKEKVDIICQIHGIFQQTPSDHCKSGCIKCGIISSTLKQKSNTNEFIEKANIVHDNEYDYSLVHYINVKTKIKIICKKHGMFEQTPNNHLRNRKCEKCVGPDKSDFKKNKSVQKFIEKAIKIHGNKYDYSLIKYIGKKFKIDIKCNKCNKIFQQEAASHLQYHGCPKCCLSSGTSNQQESLILWIKNIYKKEIIERNRKLIKPLELDLTLPDDKLAIEYNGLYWHSDEYLHKDYHLNKTNKCLEKGYDLIHIFSDEWLNKQDIIKSIIKEKLNLLDYNINLIDLEFKQLNKLESEQFFNNNHIEGFIESEYYYGLVDKDNQILSCISVKDHNPKKYGDNLIEIVQYCNKVDYNIIDGFNKLIDNIELISKDKYTGIIGKSDRRFNEDKMYIESGFKYIELIEPKFWYVNKEQRLLETQEDLYKIYDCGSKIYLKIF